MGPMIKLIILLLVCNFLTISIAFCPSQRVLRGIILPRLNIPVSTRPSYEKKSEHETHEVMPYLYADVQKALHTFAVVEAQNCPICTADHKENAPSVIFMTKEDSDNDTQPPSFISEKYLNGRKDVPGFSFANHYWSAPSDFVQAELEARFSKVEHFPDMKYSQGKWDYFNQWHGVFCAYESESNAPLLIFTTISKNEYMAYTTKHHKLLPPECILETIREMKEILEKTDEDTADGDFPRNANWFGQLEKCELLRQYIRSKLIKVVLFAQPSETTPWQLLASPEAIIRAWEKDVHEKCPEFSVSFEVILPRELGPSMGRPIKKWYFREIGSYRGVP